MTTTTKSFRVSDETINLITTDLEDINVIPFQEYIIDLKAGEAPVNTWYSLTTKGYENLSNNMAQIQRYIRQTLSIIEYYRDTDKSRQEDDEQAD